MTQSPFSPDDRAYVLAAMRPHEEALREIWGTEFGPLVDAVSFATIDWRNPRKQEALHHAVSAAAETFVFCGTRCTPPKSTQYLSLREAARVTQEASGRLPHILFSGGVEDRERIKTPTRLSNEEINEISARRMREIFLERHRSHFRDDIDARISLDQVSDNTGDQAFNVKGWMEGRVRATRKAGGRIALVICLPIEHVTRWLLTFGWAWQGMPDADRRRLDVVCLGNGSWNDETRCAMTRAEEAFTPRRLPDHSEVKAKFAYQYGERLFAEAAYGEERGYRCPALMPSQLDGAFGSVA